MSGGQSITAGQGSLGTRIGGQQIESYQGSVTASSSADEAYALTGEAGTHAAGTTAPNAFVLLKSRKVSAGSSAVQPLTGRQGAVSIGGVTPTPSKTPTSQVAALLSGSFASQQRTKALTGSGGTVTAGLLQQQGSGGAAADADWAARSTAPGVFRAFHFNDASQVGLEFTQSPTADWFYGLAAGDEQPQIDTSQKCSGTGSLRFKVPTNSLQNASGNWQCNFGSITGNPADLNLFGENTEFYISYRCRWNDAMATITSQNQGTKFGGIEIGRPEPGYPDTSGSNLIGISQQGFQNSRLPINYVYAAWDGIGAPEGPAHTLKALWPATGTIQGDDMQNEYLGGGSCLRIGGQQEISEETCWYMPVNEWVTFKFHIKMLSRVAAAPFNSEWWDVEWKMYGARFNEPFELLWSWDQSVRGYKKPYADSLANNSKFGKFRLMPYITGKDPSGAHPTGYVWCDELILSRQDIAAPGTSVYPVWRRNLPVHQFHQLAGTTAFNNSPGYADVTNAWTGWAKNGTKVYSACGSGHASWWNPVYVLDMSADVPAWVPLDPGSTFADARETSAYYADGRPTGRHNYYSIVYSDAGGIPRIIMPFGDAGYSLAGNYSSFNTDAYRLDGWTGGPSGTAWEVTGTSLANYASMWQAPPDGALISSGATAVHPVTGYVYQMGEVTGPTGSRAFRVLNPVTKTWSALRETTPAYPALGSSPIWRNTGSLIDAGRNVWVSFNGWNPATGAQGTPRLYRINLTTNAVTILDFTGDVPVDFAGQSITHDTDQDCYYILVSGSEIFTGTAQTKVYKVNPDTGASVRVFSSSNTALAVDGGNAPLGRWHYHSILKGISWSPDWNNPSCFFPTA